MVNVEKKQRGRERERRENRERDLIVNGRVRDYGRKGETESVNQQLMKPNQFSCQSLRPMAFYLSYYVFFCPTINTEHRHCLSGGTTSI